ncbi:fibrinogen-like protein 1 [Drosophila busckii]|uniref:fibrinogen-like protein 1 n=1 Tax=Drosophila busckii TaxID=30019 RepID=UPI0014332F17|nr:fibrinogen-like protein 1 [Drosophila busckii]
MESLKLTPNNEPKPRTSSPFMDQQCGRYTYETLKPILIHLHEVESKLTVQNVDACLKANGQLNVELTSLKYSLREKNGLLDAYKHNMADLRESNNNIHNEIAKLNAPTETNGKKIEQLCEKYIENSEKCEKERRNQNELLTKLNNTAQELIIKSNKINELQDQIIKLQDQKTKDEKKKLEEQKTKDERKKCSPIINLPGLMPFKVLCNDDSPAGRGWIVIQQRINGLENFQRDWNTYRDGFGSFDGDFFLGLTKIHHMTFAQRHELYIYMEKFSKEWFAARYDNFSVASEKNNFQLESLGAYTGFNDNHDNFRPELYYIFATYDRKHSYCPKQPYGGWWHGSCRGINLNGEYHLLEKKGDKNYLYWEKYISLYKVQMLIRPYNSN